VITEDAFKVKQATKYLVVHLHLARHYNIYDENEWLRSAAMLNEVRLFDFDPYFCVPPQVEPISTWIIEYFPAI